MTSRVRDLTGVLSPAGTVPSVGVVVPTLGRRAALLDESLRSLRSAGECVVVVVAPQGFDPDADAPGLIDLLVEDPGCGAAEAINEGFRALPTEVEFIGWLGDDDRLVPGAIDTAGRVLRGSDYSAVFGGCRYIDVAGRELFVNRSGQWAVTLMRFGPQLLPQPGSLFRRADVEAVDGLDPELRWAFDLDVLLKLRVRGAGIHFIREVLSEFRWHDDSLSVGGRHGSVREAALVRQRHFSTTTRRVSRLWEPLMQKAILVAGERVTRRVSQRSSTA